MKHRSPPGYCAAALLRDTPLAEADLLAMARQAAGASFMPETARAAALRAIAATAAIAACPH